jgi:uncharacterized protein YdiU (UPF0061 family)
MSNKSAMKATDTAWHFDNSYVALPHSFYASLEPVPVRKPGMAVFNQALAEALGLNTDVLSGDEGTAIFAGNRIPAGAEPIAQAYAGHQFGHFTMLGDGRAILLGEHITPDGQRFDIQLKGSGRTPFSRGGDGRSALGPMLREYIISEAMHALGIPTTRSLAVVTTGEQVLRDPGPLPGGILTRIASSHIRVGTFEYVAARSDQTELRALADYTIQRHFPDLAHADNPYLAFLQAVMERQASLVAQWQGVGFIHGVMNTDNMALSGETIDYGPCAFMDAYDPATVFSSIDRQGRYAYKNQPVIAQWNLARFTETLLPLLHPDPKTSLTLGQEALAAFPDFFQHAWLSVMRAKLGLATAQADDISLIESLLTWMQRHEKDFTNTFRALAVEMVTETESKDASFQGADFQDWHARWQTRLSQQSESLEAARQRMLSHNPAVIPRNHRVEEALKAAVEENDFSVMQKLLTGLQTPYLEKPEASHYQLPPEPNGIPYQTFCGT